MSENCNTSYWQQVKAFVNNGAVDPDPQNQVLYDLTTFIAELKADGYKIILVMDANEPVEEKNSKIVEFVNKNHSTVFTSINI